MGRNHDYNNTSLSCCCPELISVLGQEVCSMSSAICFLLALSKRIDSQ